MDQEVAFQPDVVAVGANVFRTKGLVYQGMLEFWKYAVPGGAPAVLAAVKNTGQADVAELLETKFVGGAWYPVMPMLASVVAAARVRGLPVATQVRENAAWLAERDLRGVYRILLTLSSVEAVASRLGALSMRYFDFGSAETRKIGTNCLESERIGIPMPIIQWFVWCTEGFVPVALKLAGASGVEVRAGLPRPEGERAGVATGRVRFEISWT